MDIYNSVIIARARDPLGIDPLARDPLGLGSIVAIGRRVVVPGLAAAGTEFPNLADGIDLDGDEEPVMESIAVPDVPVEARRAARRDSDGMRSLGLDDRRMDVARRMYDVMVGNGLSSEEACGVLGNIYGESRFDAGARSRSGAGRGLAQMEAGARRHYEDWKRRNRGRTDGMDDAESQALYFSDLMQGRGGKGMWFASGKMARIWNDALRDSKGERTPSLYAVQFMTHYERPGVPRADVRKRAAEAFHECFG